MKDEQKWFVAWSQFEALHRHPPERWNEAAVADYNSLLTELERAAGGHNLANFRVSDSELRHTVTGGRPQTHSGLPGKKHYSKVRTCNSQAMVRKLDGVAMYFSNYRASPADAPHNHHGFQIPNDRL